MRLETLRIVNFRGFPHETVSLAPSTVFVGANGAGKSTVLDAIRLLLGRPDPLARSWSHARLWSRADGGSSTEPCFVMGTFVDLSSTERTAWGRALGPDGQLVLGNLVTPTSPPATTPYVVVPRAALDSADPDLLNAMYMQSDIFGLPWVVAWWNAERLHSACGDAPPAEFEAAYHSGLRATIEAA